MKTKIILGLFMLASAHLSAAITFDWDNAVITGNTGSVTSGGITLSFELERFGSAGGSSPTVDTGFLVYNSENDDNGSDPLVAASNYSRLTLNFSERVSLVGNQFTIADVDDTESLTSPDGWQDFVSVRALQLGPTLEATETYTVTNATNQSYESSYYGYEGVRGINGFNASPLGSRTADVDVGVDMALDRIVIFFMQGEGGTDGLSHSILLDDIVVVPELSSLSLALLALGGVVGLRVVSRRRS